VEIRLECSALTLGNVLKVSVKYYLGFVGNLMLFLMVKEFKIRLRFCWSYRCDFGVFLFTGTQCNAYRLVFTAAEPSLPAATNVPCYCGFSVVSLAVSRLYIWCCGVLTMLLLT